MAPTILGARELTRWSFAEADFEVTVSTGDLLVALDAPGRGFRHVFPAGVGAIDEVRRQGQVTTLTPATDGARLDRAHSVEVATAPASFRGLPFLPFQVPSAWRDAQGNVRLTWTDTNVGFHVFQTTRFLRTYVSRGCVALRERDLAELADAVYFGPTALPLRVHAAPVPGATHPLPRADHVHFALARFGPPEAPTFRVRGGLYVTEKVAGPPPARGLVDVYLDAERRGRALVTASTSPPTDRTAGARPTLQ